MPDANYYASLKPKPIKKRGAGIVILIASLLVVVPVVIEEVPREQARWYQAAAQQSLDEDNFDLSLQQIGRAIALDPHQYAFHLLQSSIYERRFITKKGDTPSEDLKHAIDGIVRARKESKEEQQLFVDMQNASFKHNVGLWKDAAEQYKTILEAITTSNPYRRAVILNGYAYNAALANVDLDAALANTNEALDLISGKRRIGKEVLDEMRSAILDTRGYIHYRRAEYAPALEDIEQSLMLFAPLKQQQLKSAVDDLVRASDVKRIKEDINRKWAAMLYHRMLVNEELGLEQPQRFENAAQDAAEIKSLGFIPGPDLY